MDRAQIRSPNEHVPTPPKAHTSPNVWETKLTGEEHKSALGARIKYDIDAILPLFCATAVGRGMRSPHSAIANVC